MVHWKEGDRVRIRARAQTSEDAKNCNYFPFFAGLTGVLQKVYNEKEAVVDVDPESLPKDIRKRHDDIRDQMKTKWLEGLSEEGRSRLTEREKDFVLHYALLVNPEDLEQPGTLSSAEANPSAPSRQSLSDIEKAEERELLRHLGKREE